MDLLIYYHRAREMKNLKGRWVLLFILITGLSFYSCVDDHDPLPIVKDDQYFVSSEFKTQVTAQEIKFKLLIAQSVFPEVLSFVGLVRNNIDVQKITYTTTFQNKIIEASGLVYLPEAAGKYPVLCFQNGTNTQHSLAPSEDLESEMLFMLESVASMGFIVVIPDYIGFGISSNLPHPYLHAQSTTQSILDMLRALNEFTTEDKNVAKPTKDLFLFGYSQGGWATMLLQKEIETNYSSEFNLVASSCAAGPYSLEDMNRYITSKADYSTPYFLAYLLNAYTTLGLVTNPLSDFIKAPYVETIPALYDGNQSQGIINAALTTNMAELLTPDYREHNAVNPKFSAFHNVLMANSVMPWKMTTPTRLYHGMEDEIIPLSMSQKTLLELKAAGTPDSTIQLIPIPEVGHTDGKIPTGILTILWFLEVKN